MDQNLSLEKPELPTSKKTSESLLEYNEMEKEIEKGKAHLSLQTVTVTTDSISIESTKFSPCERKSDSPKVSLQSDNKAPECTAPQSDARDSDTAPQMQPCLSSSFTDTTNIADCINKLWSNTEEVPKRYLVLELPDRTVPQLFETNQYQPDTRISDKESTTFAIVSMEQPHETETDVTETMSQQTVSDNLQIQPEVNIQHDDGQNILGIKVQKSLEDEAFKAEEMSIKTRIHTSENITVSVQNDPQMHMEHLTVQCETTPQSNVETTSVELQVSSAEGNDIKADQGSSQPIATVFTSEKHVPMSPDDKSVTGDKIQVETKVLSLDYEIPTSHKTAVVVHPEEATVRVQMQQISIEMQDNVEMSASSRPALLQASEQERVSAEISLSEQDTIKSEMVIELELLKTTQDSKGELKDYNLKEEVSRKDVLDLPKSLDEKEILGDSQVRVLQLDIPTSHEEQEKTFVMTAAVPMADTAQSSMQWEQKETAIQVNPEEATLIVKMQRISTETPKDVAQSDSTQTVLLQPVETETISAEISLFKEDTVKPQTAIELEILGTTQKPEELKDYDLKEVSKTDVPDVSHTLDEKLVTGEKNLVEPQVRVLQIDIPTSNEEQKQTFVMTAAEPKIDTAQSSLQCEGVHVPSEEAEVIVKVQPITLDAQKYLDQSNSSQNALLQSEAGAMSAEINISKQDTVKPEKLTEQELLKNTQDRPMITKETGVQKERSELSIHRGNDIPMSLDEKAEKVQVEPDVVLPASHEEHERSFVSKADVPRTDISIQSEHSQVNKDLTSADVQPEQEISFTIKVQQMKTKMPVDLVAQCLSTQAALFQPGEAKKTQSAEISLPEQDTAEPQTMIALETLKTARSVEVKDYNMKQDVPTKDVLDSLKNLDEKSVAIKQIQVEPQVKVLQLDIPISQKEQEKIFVKTSAEPKPDTAHLSIQRERELGNKDDASAEVTQETEYIIKVQQITTDRQGDVTQSDSGPPAEVEIASAEINLSMQETVKLEPVTEQELLKTTKHRSTVTKGLVIQGEQPKPNELDDIPMSLDDKTITKEKVQGEPEVLVSPTSQEEDKRTFVVVTDVPRADVAHSSIQSEIIAVNKDLTAVEVQPEEAARPEDVAQSDSTQPSLLQTREPETVSAEICLSEKHAVKPELVTEQELLKTTDSRTDMSQINIECDSELEKKDVSPADAHPGEATVGMEVQQISTETQEDVALVDSTQPAVLPPRKIASAEISLPEGEAVQSETVTEQELMKTTQFSTNVVLDSPKSVDKLSVIAEKIQAEPQVCILQLNMSTSDKEHERTLVMTAAASRTDTGQAIFHGEIEKEQKDKTAEVHPEEAAVRMEEQQIITERQEDVQFDSVQPGLLENEAVSSTKIIVSEPHSVKSEIVSKQEILKTTEDRPMVTKDLVVQAEPSEASVTVKEKQISAERPKIAAQSDFTLIALRQSSEAETTSAQIRLPEQDIVKQETLIELKILEIAQVRPTGIKELGVKEGTSKLLMHGMDDVPTSLSDKSVTVEEVVETQIDSEVLVLQVEVPTSRHEHKQTSFMIGKSDSAQPALLEPEVSGELLKTTEDRPIVTKDLVVQAEPSEASVTVKEKQISTERPKIAAQSDSTQTTLEQSSEAETTSAQIRLPEQDIVKQETLIELKILEIAHPKVLTHGVEDVPTSLDVKFVKMKKIQMDPEVLVIPEVREEHVSRTDTSRSSIQCESSKEHRDTSAAEVLPEEAGVKTRVVEVQQFRTEMKEGIAQTDAAQSVLIHAGETESTCVEISLSERDTVKPETLNKLKFLNATEERPKDVNLREEFVTKDVLDAPKGQHEVSVTVEKLSMGSSVPTLQPNIPATITTSVVIATSARTDSDQTTTKSEKITQTQELRSLEAEKEKPASEMNKADAPKSFTKLLSEPVVYPKVQTDATNRKEEEEKQKKKIQEKEKERSTSVELPFSISTTTTITTMEATGTRLKKLPQEQVFSTDTSLQVVQISSGDTVLGEEPHLKGLTPQENKIDANDMETEKTELESPGEPSILTVIQLLKDMGPSSQLIEGKPLEDAPEVLISSTSSMDSHLSRVISKLLNCKNRSAELSPTAMAQQVEEAQECREAALAQVALLSQLRGAVAENRDTLEHLEDQWSSAAQDAANIIQSKEAQLQMVTDYCQHIQTAKNAVDKATAELDALQTSPQESSSKEAERLGSLQRSMEENRTALGELLVTHSKLCPHLTRYERAIAETEQKNLQERWRVLERTVESMLHHTHVRSHKTSNLLSELSDLQEHLEMIIKDLEAKFPSVTQWNCKKARQLMEANAEVKAAQQKYLHLQQLSELLLFSPQWEMETKEIHQGLQSVKDKISHTEELLAAQTLNSNSPIMEKIVIVMREGLAWARQTESDIEGRKKRVALLPEEVHRQLRDLKKLQSEVMAKQGQLESLAEEMTELLPQLDQVEEVPMVQSLLKCLEELSKSTNEKLSKAVKEVESGLQTREKLSEQIADLDSWVVAHLQREASRGPDSELRSPAELDRRTRQIQETLDEAEKQEAVCEALFIKSKDITSEFSVTENCQLFDKLTNLQEKIRTISSQEKNNKKELNELTQTLDSSKKKLVTVENSLRQMLVDLSRHRFPITRESLQALEPFKHMILEHKSQVDLLQPWIPNEKTKELNSVISELHSKMCALEMKARDQERYLNMRQCVEDLRESIQEQVHQTKEDGNDTDEKYRICQNLLIQFHLMKGLCEEARSKLHTISADLYPSQLTAEQQRLKQNEESLSTLEMTLYNNLSIIEWNLLMDLDLESERKATKAFLLKTQKEFEKLPMLEPNDTAIDREYERVVSLTKTVESRMRALGVLEQKKGKKKRSGSQDLMDLKNAVLGQCESHMENITQARESLRSYTCSVKQAVQFLRDIEVSMLPPQGSAGVCGDRVEETQQALASLQQQFQIHVEQLQDQTALHPYLSPLKVEQLQESILSQLLVMMSTLQAKGHVKLECLSRCAEQHRNYIKCKEEIMQSVKSTANRLLQLITQKVTCLTDCTDQEANLRALAEEMEALLRRLEELQEWCSEQSCRGSRETPMTCIWRWVLRLRHCTQELTTRSKQRIREWSDISDSVEKASVLLQGVEAELPDSSKVKASTEELQDVLQSWEQYQDRLDCEHRALSALELRTARLLGVPAHLEQAPPIQLCQQLQAMQGRYDNVKQRSREGLQAARQELEDREKVREELQGIRVWLKAAASLLTEMEQSSSTQELQALYSQLCTQKSLLHRIMENLKMKYSDMYTLVPVEIDSQIQDITKSLQQVEEKVGEAIERSGPVHRLGARMSDIEAGLRSVQKRLEQRSPTVTQAKITQKRAWDELDAWHSRLAALEVDMQDLEKPEEVLILTERLVEVQQLHSQLAKQAEQRTTLISKIQTWLQEHQEMVKSSKSWMSEAQSWLAAPCTYTTAKCLSSHVHALQLVLDDSVQIRNTLQGFSSVLKEMSQVCDVTALQEQLVEADRQVADVQDSFTAPLSQLEHAAAEVEAIESEVKRMENDVAEIKNLLSSPESFPSPREDSLKAVEQRIQSMRRTVAEIQKCKPGLCLPEKAEETLTVFTVVDQLQTLLLELEKKVPALFIQQPPTPTQAKAQAAQQTTTELKTSASEKATSEEAEEEQGQIRIARVEEDVLRRSGATLLTVEQSSPEQRQAPTPDITQEPVVVASEETEAATGQSTEQPTEDTKDVEGTTDTTETSSSEALSKPLGAVTTQSLPESMESDQQVGSQSGPRLFEGVLHVCLERLSQLELWLQKSQRSLQAAGVAGVATMQDSVEQQLLTCQEMFLEIEQKVASLSALSQTADQQHQQSELGAAGSQQEAAELLTTRLELLKNNLVSFQQMLQNRQEEERMSSNKGPQEQHLVSQADCQLESKERRSNSVQEIFSSPKNKLLRQSSLQQQKELEHELSEQRGLTQAIARHGSRALLYRQESEDHSQLSLRSPPAAADEEEDSAQKKWDHLHSQLLALEESWLLPPSEVTDSSVKRSNGTAGCMIARKNLKELQTCISHLRELGHTSAELLNQACPAEGTHQTVDEGLFHVLHGASLCLDSMKSMLCSPVLVTHEEEPQLRLLHLQSLSAELATLGSELVSQGSKVSNVPGLKCGQQCIDDLCRLLPVVQIALASREKQLRILQEDSAEKQAAAHIQESLQQQVEADQHNLPASLIHQATQLQGELETVVGGVRSHCEELKSGVELQKQYEQLVRSFEELLSLGSDSFTQQPDTELRSRAQLQKKLSSHMRFFQFLGDHFEILRYLTNRVSDMPLENREVTIKGLQDQVARLQQDGLEKGTKMQETLEMWSQWEKDSAWSDSLMRSIETSFPKIPEGSEQESEKPLSYKELHRILEENEARVSQMLEGGRRLQRAGFSGVGVSVCKLEARWTSLHKRLEHERTNFDKGRKLKSRFRHSSAALSQWMNEARQRIDRWSELTVSSNEEMDVEQRRELYLQSVALTKELEAKSEVKVAVTGSSSQLLQLREAHSERDPEDKGTPLPKTSDIDMCSINTQLRQIELDWSSLLVDVPVIQQTLHKRWLEMQTQQGALLELQAWLGAAECQLEEYCNKINKNSCTNNDLAQFLKYFKESQTEMCAHQITVDYVNQPLQSNSTEKDHRLRYEQNQYADEQGRLNHQWLSLQEKINSKIQEVEQELRNRVECDARLQRINSWIAVQNLWMDSAQTPSSQTELQRSISVCQDLEEKIMQKSAALQELIDKVCGRQENRSCNLICQIDKSIETCAALTQRNDSVKQRLTQAQLLWSNMEEKLSHMVLKTVRASQTLKYYSGPRLSLQALTDLHEKLQLLQQETEASEVEWDKLGQNILSLRDTISPAAAAIISKCLDRQRDSWTIVTGALGQQLQRCQKVLTVWQVYDKCAGSLAERLQALQSDATSVLSSTPGQDNTVKLFTVKIENVQSFLQRTDTLQSDLEVVLKASKDLISHLEPSAASLVQSECRLLPRGVLQLRQQLSKNLGHLQEELKQVQEFENEMESLERNLEVWQQRLEDPALKVDQSGLMELSGLSADLDVLNERSCSLTLEDAAAHRLQFLNRRWADASARAEEACSELQTEVLRQQRFEQKCESWMSFLQRMEDSLAVDVAGSYDGLRQQLCTHKHFQAELSIGHQILHSVITDALHLLQKGEVEGRSDFILKLAQLREQWQGAVQRADQRRSLVEGLVKHWHLYSRSLRKLQRFLADTQTLLPSAGLTCCSLQQLRRSLHDLQHKELLFQRYQSSFINTLEVGRQLFSMGDEETQTQLQTDLGTLQEEWDNLHSLLFKRLELTEAIIKNWERCETGLTDSMLQLKDMKTRLNQTMPECDDDLESAKLYKKNKISLEDWAESLTELSSMKTDLSQYIIADDVLLLQEQVEHLHCQWEELCFKVSLRKQEIADRLNAWIIFNEKNKELCEWLTQMENKVAHNSDLNIEEMVEKLKKDCMEEINLFSENKTHLKQLGEQLITASNKTKETEINDKLKDVNDRWQHLFDHIEARVRKLKETLVTVQQLDKNMSNLRTWLSRIETELAKPVVYSTCHSDEIQRKLAEQQDLQRDIEQHTESVASVLTLCDVLLHDADACGSDSENDSIQQTTLSLDRRWRNICAMSMERRMRIEETWRLWCKFLDDYSRFEHWLKTAELTAASPDSADVLYTSAKEELKKFEAFQRQVHERLTQLELVNKQYRRLARENRTDAASKLKVMVHEGNQRWDSLQRRVAAVLRRLKYFTSQREDFEGTREGILVWLTEMDLQLTNVEHFSESDIEEKMRELNGFQQEITLNTNKIDALIVFGENLIQKSAPLDAVLIEDELEELHSYCQEVFGRVARFHHRLVNRRPVLEEEEREMSDRDTDRDDSPDLTPSWMAERRRKEVDIAVGGVSGGPQVMCHLLVPPIERSGRETPLSVDSIPLEWDHTVDVGGSSSHEDDEDATFFSALSDMKVTENSESFFKVTASAVKAASVTSVTDMPSWHLPGSPERKQLPRDIIQALSSFPTHTTGTPFNQQGYAKLMSECSGSIDSVKRVKLMLNDEEELEDAGLTSSTASKHTSTGVIERWELLQAHKNAADIKQNLEQWQKLNSDLSDVTSWLGRVLPELERLKRIAPSTSIRDIEVNIRKFKEMQKIFNSYKCLMISINLSSRHFLRDDSTELHEQQEALDSANHSWTQACSGLESWERSLHSAVMQCQEFHETLHSLLLWLAQAEDKLRTVNVNDRSHSALLQHRDTLTALQEELRGRQRRVSSLQAISSQLLLEATGEDSVEAKEKVHVISNKLHLLLRQVAADLRTLQGTLEEAGLQAAPVRQSATKREERQDSSPQRPLFYRVLRAAFPLHLLFFMLLVLACLVPLSEENYSCTLTNNFARSFYPMLHYTNGPPPT
ncbi:nesprin-2 isoform X4 [Haplochromis burtoni]|uniref:nesprin-2 isoform X4 n=1 Tax=Haplochromis burtoni TaxID=8153 RepID=UPI001C2CD9E0|nr:nesprin-2 isoform X4 [Haplochromis burtoni]